MRYLKKKERPIFPPDFSLYPILTTLKKKGILSTIVLFMLFIVHSYMHIEYFKQLIAH